MLKLSNLLLVILLPFLSFGQRSFGSSSKRIDSLIVKNEFGNISKVEKSELRRFGFAMQNRGFRLEEYNHDYANALIPIDSALLFWMAIKDTASEANLRKYKGLLLAHLQKFEEGKKEIRLAIYLFQTVGFDYGMAVSQIDFSQLYDLEGKLDSALFMQLQATAFWKKELDTSRIIVNNTQLMHIYFKLRKYKKAQKIQTENVLLITPDEHWNPTINFYFASLQLFLATKNTNQAKKYQGLYEAELAKLKNKGIAAKSIYDFN